MMSATARGRLGSESAWLGAAARGQLRSELTARGQLDELMTSTGKPLMSAAKPIQPACSRSVEQRVGWVGFGWIRPDPIRSNSIDLLRFDLIRIESGSVEGGDGNALVDWWRRSGGPVERTATMRKIWSCRKRKSSLLKSVGRGGSAGGVDRLVGRQS